MSRNKWLALPLLLLCSFSLHSEESGWVLAAERFTAKDVPPVYENFPDILPALILSRLGGINSRMVSADEKKARDLQVLSDALTALVRARAALLLEKDRILLSAQTERARQKNRKAAEKKIAAKEREIRAMNGKIAARLAENTPAERKEHSLALWKGAGGLYKRREGVSLSTSLKNDKISGLITGTVEDIAGYMYVTIRVETGIGALRTTDVSQAAAYEDVEQLVASLSERILPEIANREPVVLRLSLMPENARVFIDGRLLPDTSSPVTVFAGEHTISVTADGYASAEKKTVFENSSSFKVSVTLEKENTVSVAFDTGERNASLFIHARYFGETPKTVVIPAIPAIGEAVALGIPTFFIFRPDAESEGKTAGIRTNRVTTEKRIEKQRSILYWSLGALYISLPFSMLSYGIAQNLNQAVVDDKIMATDATVAEINAWSNAAIASRYISIGLGVNYLVQLVRYFIAAEQAVPQNAD